MNIRNTFIKGLTLVSALLAMPFYALAQKPVYYMPLDSTAEVLGADGKALPAGITYGRSIYREGVSGKALDVIRHAYDQVTAINFSNLPSIDVNEGTVSFWFKPSWKGNDDVSRWIFSGSTDKFRYYFIKGKMGSYELSVCAPVQIQILIKDLFEQNQWAHVAFSWSTKESESRLYINGREVATKKDKTRFKHYTEKQSPSIWFGVPGHDRFKARVGDGLYDEIKIFDKQLSSAEIFSLATDTSATKLINLDATKFQSVNGKTSFVLKNKEARYTGPQKLVELKDANGAKISFVAMGASGKISMSYSNADNKASVESNYVLSLSEPHKIDIENIDNKINFYLDNALQGSIEKVKPFALKSASGTESITIQQPTTFPDSSAQAILDDSQTTSLESTLWDLSDAQKTSVASIRKGICLNGYWRVLPTNTYSYAPPKEKWGYMRVPGSFRSPLFKIHTEKNGILSGSDYWKNKSIIDYRAAWYKRSFTIPSHIDGKRIYLNFENLNTDYGRIYFNGKLIDSYRQDFKTFTVVPNSRRIDVTDYINKSGNNTITLFLDRSYTGLWHGVPAIGDHSEIAIGDVWLESAPSAISLKNAIALPSYRKSEVKLSARIQNLNKSTGKAYVTFKFTHNGEDKVFKNKFSLDGTKSQLIEFTESWKKPVLWDVENPNLYNMSVSLEYDGNEIDRLPNIKFGFREAWVENGAFKLNGKNLRLRMWTSPILNRLRYYYGHPKAIKEHVAHIKSMNYDTVRFDPYGKSSQVGWDAYFNECNIQGLYNLVQMPHYEDEDITIYKNEVRRFLEYYGNNPNILMWYTDFNTCGYPWGQDPAKLNDTEYDPVSKAEPRRRARTAESVMRAIDPSRELFQHAGGNSGKIFTSMNYQSFGTPLQEQEDWPKQWAENHTQPLMVVESAFPYPGQFIHFDNPSLGTIAAEHGARYFGDEAFKQEVRPVPYWNGYNYSPYANPPANIINLSKMLYEHVVPAWRAYGMSALGDFPGGRDLYLTAVTYDKHNVVYERRDDVKTRGIKPENMEGFSETQTHILTDYSRPAYLDSTIKKVFEPLLVYLGGMPSDFTNKDNAFFSGEKFEKSAVVVNDYYSPKSLDFVWELRQKNNNSVIQQGKFSANVEAGGISKLPIKLTAPEVLKRTEAVLSLQVFQNGKLFKEDSFEMRFFPTRVKPEFFDARAVLYDPVGKTELMLKKAGFPFTKADSIKDLRKSRLLIIGQNALSTPVPSFIKNAEKEGLFNAGLKVVIFEQKQCNIANLVFESPSYRNAFIRRKDSPYVSGLEDVDFANWRGSSDTVKAFVLSDPTSPHYPRSKWKCGNGGIVSGNVIRKPSFGNFESIVDCGFNLNFSSLMELRKGHGSFLFCQLDVTSRYLKDPVATKVVDNILEWSSKPFSAVDGQRVCYIGDENGEKFLNEMGFKYTKLHQREIWKVSMYQVVIFGGGKYTDAEKNAIRNATSKNKNHLIVVLPDADLSLFHHGIKLGKKKMYKATIPAPDPMFYGIPASDTYFRCAYELPVFENMPDWAVATNPAIVARVDNDRGATLYLSVYPSNVEGLWNKERMYRFWNAIFSNYNITTGKSLKVFTNERSRHNQLVGTQKESKPKKSAKGKAAKQEKKEQVANVPMEFSPYISDLDFYDGDAFHNW